MTSFLHFAVFVTLGFALHVDVIQGYDFNQQFQRFNQQFQRFNQQFGSFNQPAQNDWYNQIRQYNSWSNGNGAPSSSSCCGLDQPSSLVAAESCDRTHTPHGLWVSPGHSLHGLWSGGIDWVSAEFVEKSNGDAEISGVLTDSNQRWNLVVSLSGRQSTAAGLSPLQENQGGCSSFNCDSWYFYRSLSGTLVNVDTGSEFEISMNTMHPAQVGEFANLKNGNQGISFWMFIKDCYGQVVKADLNSDIVCGQAPVNSCRQNEPHALVEAATCSGSSSPHGLWVKPGHELSLWSGGAEWVSAELIELANGEAYLTGVLAGSDCRFEISICLSGRQDTEYGLSPLKQNQGECGNFDSDNWYFYRSLHGTLTNVNTREEFEISMNTAHPAQVGEFANLKNGNFGISFWMFISDCNGNVANADINSDILC